MKYVLKPGLELAAIPGVGVVLPGQVIEGDEFARFVPGKLVEVKGAAPAPKPKPKSKPVIVPVDPETVDIPESNPSPEFVGTNVPADENTSPIGRAEPEPEPAQVPPKRRRGRPRKKKD